MKKTMLIIVVLCMLLCACSGNSEAVVTQAEYNKVSEELTSIKTKMENTESEVKKLTEENAGLKSEIESKDKEYDKLTEENKMLNIDMSEEKKLYDDMSDKYDKLQNQYDYLQGQYNTLNTEYSEYKKKMQPFEELDEKEAEARKIEAEKKIKEEEEKKKKAEEEEQKKKEEEEKKGYNTGITYNQLARTPDDYIAKKIKFSGKVLQVLEGTNETHIRLAVNNSYDTVLYCAYDPSILTFRLLEDDKITIYGYSLGLYSYTATSGATITIPSVWVDKIELKK